MAHADDALAWIAQHPDAMAVLERLALNAAMRGRRFGMKALAERVRWEFTIERTDADDFKLNNNHVAYIARELMERHPFLDQYMETRTAGVAHASPNA